MNDQFEKHSTDYGVILQQSLVEIHHLLSLITINQHTILCLLHSLKIVQKQDSLENHSPSLLHHRSLKQEPPIQYIYHSFVLPPPTYTSFLHNSQEMSVVLADPHLRRPLRDCIDSGVLKIPWKLESTTQYLLP